MDVFPDDNYTATENDDIDIDTDIDPEDDDDVGIINGDGGGEERKPEGADNFDTDEEVEEGVRTNKVGYQE